MEVSFRLHRERMSFLILFCSSVFCDRFFLYTVFMAKIKREWSTVDRVMSLTLHALARGFHVPVTSISKVTGISNNRLSSFFAQSNSSLTLGEYVHVCQALGLYPGRLLDYMVMASGECTSLAQSVEKTTGAGRPRTKLVKHDEHLVEYCHRIVQKMISLDQDATV